tara:strand:+ start:568 stop:717 length:150 start_codon:yes stop_codon:yes gene_type:complete
MKHFITLACAILLSCGGGGTNSSSTPSPSATSITGLQGDLNAIEPIDLD